MSEPAPKSGKIDLDAYPWLDLAAKRIWTPRLEGRPADGWFLHDGICNVTWFSGMDLKCTIEVYVMERGMALAAARRQAGEVESPRPRGGHVAEVHVEMADGSVRIFDVSEEWYIETIAKERKTP